MMTATVRRAQIRFVVDDSLKIDNTRTIYAIDAANDACVGRIQMGYPSNTRQRACAIVCGWLNVDPAYQRRGVGTLLFRQFLEWANGRSFYVEFSPEGKKFIKAYEAKFGKIAGMCAR